MNLDWFLIYLSYAFPSHKRKLTFLAIVMATSGKHFSILYLFEDKPCEALEGRRKHQEYEKTCGS